jgi:ABC-type transport system substrate-binding protein
MRATFASLTANVTQLSERVIMNKLQGYNIPYAENRWTGFNRGAWNNPDFDRVEKLFNTTLDRGERDQLMIQLMRIVNEDVGVIPLYYNPDTVPHVSALRGPTVASPDTIRDWNIYEWEWVR